MISGFIAIGNKSTGIQKFSRTYLSFPPFPIKKKKKKKKKTFNEVNEKRKCVENTGCIQFLKG